MTFRRAIFSGLIAVTLSTCLAACASTVTGRPVVVPSKMESVSGPVELSESISFYSVAGNDGTSDDSTPGATCTLDGDGFKVCTEESPFLEVTRVEEVMLGADLDGFGWTIGVRLRSSDYQRLEPWINLHDVYEVVAVMGDVSISSIRANYPSVERTVQLAELSTESDALGVIQVLVG